jgi:hypothetical protein
MSEPKLFIIDGEKVLDPMQYQQQEDAKKIIKRSERRVVDTKLTHKPFERLAAWNTKNS